MLTFLWTGSWQPSSRGTLHKRSWRCTIFFYQIIIITAVFKSNRISETLSLTRAVRCCVVSDGKLHQESRRRPPSSLPRANQFRVGQSALRSALLGRQKRLACYFSRHFNLELGLPLRDYPLWARPGAQGVLSPGTRKWSIGSNPSPSSMTARISLSASRFSEQTVLNWRIWALSVTALLRVWTWKFYIFGVIDLSPYLTVLVYKGNVYHYKDGKNFTLHAST